MFACSFWKRQLETSSRFTYLVPAYRGLKQWIAKGDANTTQMKRYIMRHLQIPPREDGFTDTILRQVSSCSLAGPNRRPPPQASH